MPDDTLPNDGGGGGGSEGSFGEGAAGGAGGRSSDASDDSLRARSDWRLVRLDCGGTYEATTPAAAAQRQTAYLASACSQLDGALRDLFAPLDAAEPPQRAVEL